MKVRGTLLKFGAENFLSETIFSDCEIDIPKKVPFLSDFHSRKVIGYAEVVRADGGLIFTGEITDPDAIEMLATTHTMGCGGHYNCVERDDGQVVKMKLVEVGCVCAPVNPEYTFEIVDDPESSIDDTLKLIIEIPKELYENKKGYLTNMDAHMICKAVKNGIPLDDVISIDQANAMIKSYVSHYEENKGEYRPKGEWIKNAPENQFIDPPYICSECGRAELRKENFCCSCGADMRGEE